MKARVVASAEPTNLQWVFVLIVMGVDCFNAADLANLFFQLPGLQRFLDRQMRVVFCWVCSAPICLSRLALDHDFSPVMMFRTCIAEGDACGVLRATRSTCGRHSSIERVFASGPDRPRRD
ncbi:hypothetical protein A9Z06_28195 [Rhizobium sp. YK2]|nr:hypothetical protein A9Z06_28195 [Rhizobium sp. YK2]